MKLKAIRTIAIACALLLLVAFRAAAQSGEPVTVTTTERVPIIVDVSEEGADASNVITATLIVTKEVVLLDNEVISHNVSSQILLPEDAPVTVAQLAEPSLSASVAAVDVPASPTVEATGEVIEEATVEATVEATETAAAETVAAETGEGDDVARANRGANLRGGPGTNYPVIGGVQTGDELEIVAQNSDGSWYKLASGEWIAAFLVDNAPTDLPIAEAPPVPTAVPQAAAPSGGGETTLEQDIAEATAAIARNPNDADAYARRGFAYAQQSNYQAALPDLNRAIELDPSNGVIYFIRAVVYEEMGNFGQAIQDATQAINLGFVDAAVYELRAVCYLELENYAQALPDLEKLLQLNPNHPQRSEIEALIQRIRQGY